MAYQIKYTDNAYIKQKISSQKRMAKWGAVICVGLLIGYLLNLDAVQDFFIPGDPEITKSAFSSLKKDLHDGERFTDAAAAFCRQILESDIVE